MSEDIMENFKDSCKINNSQENKYDIHEIEKCGSVSENKGMKNQKFFFFKRSIKLINNSQPLG